MKARTVALTAASTLLVIACSRTPDGTTQQTTSEKARATMVTPPLPEDLLQVTPSWSAPNALPNALFIPPAAVPTTPGGNTYTISMVAGVHNFGLPGGLLTPVWGYTDGKYGMVKGKYVGYLGPTIVTKANLPYNPANAVTVRWVNKLPTQLPFAQVPYGTNNYPSEASGNYGPHLWATTGVGSAVAHLHGGHTDSQFDGIPNQYFAPGQSRVYTYRNDQEAATIWYHDHALGYTRLNVYAGLAGGWVVSDKFEKGLNLPSGKYDIPLIVQDKTFRADGSLYYPEMWTPEFFGDVAVVNGTAFPTLNVEARKYRFRIVNGSQSRFYRFRIPRLDETLLPINQIGSDGGLLLQTASTDKLLLGPGERADVILDFSGLTGENLTLWNDAETPFSGGFEDPGEVPLPEIMQFVVGPAPRMPDTSVLPTTIRPITPYETADNTRELVLGEHMDSEDNPIMAMLGLVTPEGVQFKKFDDPSTENPTLNTVEEWVFINTTGDVHPMHLHLVQFQVVERRKVELAEDGSLVLVDGKPVYSPAERGVAPNETGWKDTVQVYPGEATVLRARFDMLGEYVWHCHILEHEENDMMRPFVVVP
jgi:spore coat protein A